MARDIVIGIVGDASKFNAATTQAVQHTETLTGKLQNVGKGMVIGAGIGAFNLLTGAIDAGIGKLDEAHDAFLRDQAGQELLAQALRNNIPAWDGSTAAVEEYAAAQAKLGFADDDVRDSLAQLVGVTHDITEATKLNSLAEDLSRSKHIDLATAVDIVTKAHEGNGKALKALGIDVEGVTTAAGLLDAVQKNVNGSAQAWAQTNEGKLAPSNVKVQEAMEKVGSVVDKLSQIVFPAAAQGIGILGDVFVAVGGIIDRVLQGVAEAGRSTGVVIGRAILVGKLALNGLISIVNTVIGAINALKFPTIDVGPVHIDGFGGFNLPKIPSFHEGGIVPGSPGSDQLAILQAGERVIARGEGGQTIVINIETFIGSDRDIDRFTDRIAYRLRLLG